MSEIPVFWVLLYLLAALMATALLAKHPRAPVEEPKLIQCPDCQMTISRRALMCPHCGLQLNHLEVSEENAA